VKYKFIYLFIIFCHCQFATTDLGEEIEEDVSERASFKTADGGGMEDNGMELQEELLESPLPRRTTEVRSTNSVFTFCDKQWSFKLHVKGASNSHVGSTLL
jgi:hypothetical protein